jgi:hypothetical protein
MTWIEVCFRGRLRMLNWKSGDIGPKLMPAPPGSILKAMKEAFSGLGIEKNG